MIFDIIKGDPVINPEALTIPEIKKIWDSDKSLNKDLATRKITYIYHIADPRSAYAKVGEEQRKKLVEKDHLRGFKYDKELKEAVDKYKLLQRTLPLQLLEGVESQIEKMARFLKETELDEKNLIKISMVMGKSAELITSHQQLQEKVEQQLQMGTRIKRDIKPNMFDDEYTG